jgi:cobalamin synthase
MGLAFAATLILTGYLKRKIEGITGNTIGALNELIEVFILLVICYFT